MSSPDRPFTDSTIGYDKWAANLARTDEERARIDRAHLIEGVEIFFRGIEENNPLDQQVFISSSEEMPSFVKEFVGDYTFQIIPDYLVRVFEDSKASGLSLKCVSRYSPDYDSRIDVIKNEESEVPTVVAKRTYPVIRNKVSPLGLIRVANWIVDYYREQTGQQPQVASTLDAK